MLEGSSNLHGIKRLEPEVSPVLTLPLVEHFGQGIGGARSWILEDIALDVVDRQHEVVSTAFGFSP
jgi:hypothetical protein